MVTNVDPILNGLLEESVGVENSPSELTAEKREAKASKRVSSGQATSSSSSFTQLAIATEPLSDFLPPEQWATAPTKLTKRP